ncbi:dihydroxyacetone kinase phosphoryl donor subunit DhaM [Amycolatopsis rhabdoformis]|uniref:Phosphocarrier protein HPr n=1 Tax=Amycolatopsis rhabdoformis TaxID=1448059 RepID=A0ABZ1HZE9_9PSEU|nr:dihydroxyacetone kinase phosphoryl donor subunit DhaM [Amycolatopsis rhabdoformis]WSE26738.1 dihydroxyacetone kinase phosphoryl donor subunit DhaM [Amycolatopsis rhabdoformis]
MTVGIVLVSHSAKLADGLADLAAQMAPDVRIIAAGGLPDDGGLGTDYDEVVAATQRADSGDGVVLLYDLGSAQMTAELAVESLSGGLAAVVADGPLVEGAIAAAVAAQSGADRAAVSAAAAEAGLAPDLAAVSAPGDGAQEKELTLANEVGLHARPAAVLVRSLAALEAEVTVRLGEQEADAHSVLALMSLGARQGDHIVVRAKGPQASDALAKVTSLVESNFGE